MATRWKKYEMYGPKKPSCFKRWYWYWKDKLLSMNVLYLISVGLLMLFAVYFIEWACNASYYLTLPVYSWGILNVILWIYLIRHIDKDTSKPFFMNWMKTLDCDLLLLFYVGILCTFAIILLMGRSFFWYAIYDVEGYWVGRGFVESNFMPLFLPMALVNNAFGMNIIRHLKTPELRKATFCKKILERIKHWLNEKNIQYQRRYPFEKKVQFETAIMGGILVGIGGISLISVGFYGFLRFVCAMLVLIGAIVVFLWIYNHKIFLNDVGTLVSEIHEVSEGNTLKKSSIPENSMIYDAGEDLTHVYANLNESVKRQVQSEKMKIDLITNVSHDLKTPLTSIIGYIDLLKKTELNDEARDYVDILSVKSERLKYMIQEVFEISKATSGNMDLHIETLDICTLIRQILGDMEEQIQSSHRIIRQQLSAEPLYVLSDSQKMYRIYQNLVENALKYSLTGSRIFIDAFGNEKEVVTIIKNTSSYEMDFTEDTITERFTRGDINRTTEGHGLGLAIVKSFAEACGGKFNIEIDGDLFKAIVVFRRDFPEEIHNEKALMELPEKIYDK